MPNNGLRNTDQRVLQTLCDLVVTRDQNENPITHAEIAELAIVSHRTTQTCLQRLADAGLIEMVGGGRGISPIYLITEAGEQTLEVCK